MKALSKDELKEALANIKAVVKPYTFLGYKEQTEAVKGIIIKLERTKTLKQLRKWKKQA